MPSVRHRTSLFALLLAAIVFSQGIELFVNRVLRPDAEEITWISDVVLSIGLAVVSWLWVRLRETQIALTDLDRQRIVSETQLTVAARVQRSLLPALPVSSAGVSWHAAVEPAGKVGGDYYDFLPLPDGRMCVVLADVSGKGVAAAVFVANVRAILRALASQSTRPQMIVAGLSSALLADSTSGLYVTCIVAIIDPARRTMVYVNAGHPAGVLWNTRSWRGLRVGGPPAGLLPDATFNEEELTFGDDDLVVFVSDGITEALDAGGDSAIDAIAAVIAAAHRRTPEAVCARLLSVAGRSNGPSGVDGWMDDRTAVVFGVSAQ